MTRTVTDGAVRPINPSAGGASAGADGKLFPAVNNGVYSGHMHIISIGVTVAFDEIFGALRKNVPMNDWERTLDSPAPAADKEEDQAKLKAKAKVVSSDAPKWEDAPSVKKPDTWKPTLAPVASAPRAALSPMEPEPELVTTSAEAPAETTAEPSSKKASTTKPKKKGHKGPRKTTRR